MELGSATGITDKIFSVGKKLAPLAGVWTGFMAEPLSDGRTFEDIPNYLYNRLFVMDKSIGKGHFPNPLVTTTMALAQPERYPIMSGATMAIIGWIGEYLGRSLDAGQIGRIITNFGTVAKNFGVAEAISAVVGAYLYLAPYNPAGIGQSGTGGSPTVTMYPQKSFAAGGPGFPHATGTNGFASQLGKFESVVA